MEFVPRSVWGARPPKSVITITTSEFLFVHHSVTDDGDDDYDYHEDEHALLRQIQNYHMDTKGWLDIAYSVLVGQSGRVYEGRGWGVAGGHTEGWNSRSHAVCWMGNSDIHEPTKMALNAIEAVHAEYLSRYPRSPKRSHREVNSTGCPGGKLYAYVNTHPYPPSEEFHMDAQVQFEFDEIKRRLDNDHLPIAKDTNIWVKAKTGQVDAAALADAIAEDLGEDMAKQVADELAKRLAS